MVSTRPLISKSSSPFTKRLAIEPRAPITIGIIIAFMFHSFISSLARSRYLSLRSLSFNFIWWSTGTVWATISLFYLFESFSHERWMVFHCGRNNSKFPQVSRSLLSILAVFNIAVVWTVSTRPPTSRSSSPFSNPLVTVPKAPITIGIIVTRMFRSFFDSLARPRYLSFFSHSFSFFYYYLLLQSFSRQC